MNNPENRQSRQVSNSPDQLNNSKRNIFHHILQFFSHLNRYGWDLAGIGLILIALLTFLGLVGISRGILIDYWIVLIKKSFGWGTFGIILILAGLGYAAIRHKAGKPFPIRFGQVLAIEGGFFSLLALIALFSKIGLEKTEAGNGGGTIGWGLSVLLPGILGMIVYTTLFLICIIIATGLNKNIKETLLSWSEIELPNGRTQGKLNQDTNKSSQVNGNRAQDSDVKIDVNYSEWRDDRLPPLNLLLAEQSRIPDKNQIRNKAVTIENTLAEFGYPVKVIGYRIGPTVTQFALEPGFIEKPGPDGVIVQQKVRVSQIANLSRDVALALSASRLRIETPVPGRSYVGIEVPNSDATLVRIRPILESNEFKSLKSPLALGLGRNVSGEPIVADLAKMPHLLIAGTTNSGKSVCITAITTCLVMNNTPHDLRLVMLDPKMVELVRFNGIPHLLGKVETELERMLAVLRWAQAEMDTRYRMLAEEKVRNLESYNRKMLQKKHQTLPRIVILIDELADLMMSAPDQTEHSLIRLAQMARATGIHLVVATQRPSTDIVTGLIKANFPARISFAVASSVDSRVILDSNGAEDLLGKGDMLFLDPAKSGMQRIQGILVGDSEVEKILSHWQKMVTTSNDIPAPWEGLIVDPDQENSDQLIDQAIGVVKTAGKASASLLQRRLHVGYPRAARLIDELEEMGIVGPSVGSGKDRDVIIEPDENPTSDYRNE
jgi:S-DNA-T family DNA segregation ATPase FtsK/SpoIIIE